MTNEMEKLIKALEALEIPHTVEIDMFDCPQVFYPARRGRIMDAICNDMSYGHDEGLLEIMGLLTPGEEEEDEVIGFLTAEDVLERILRHRREEVERIFED